MTLAIGVMARAPVPGRCKTRLLAARSPEWVARLQRTMLEDTLERLGAVPAGVRLVLVAPLAELDARALVEAFAPAGWSVELQRGEHLGARLEHAMAALFARGATRAMIVGSDCPHLPLEGLDGFDDLAGASARHDVAIGPTEDGGYYLIAANRSEPGLFRGVAWSTPEVFAQTLARCDALGLRVRRLARSYDVDEPADLLRLGADLARAPELAPRTAAALRGP